MIDNPFPLASASAPVWCNGFVLGLTGPDHSIDAPENVPQEDVDAFNAGVLAGQQVAVDGLSLSDPCVPAAEEGNEVGHAITGVEILHAAWDMRKLATLAHGIAGLAVAFVELACTLPKHTLPVEQVLPNLGQTVTDTMSAFGGRSRTHSRRSPGTAWRRRDCSARPTRRHTSPSRDPLGKNRSGLAQDQVLLLKPLHFAFEAQYPGFLSFAGGQSLGRSGS